MRERFLPSLLLIALLCSTSLHPIPAVPALSPPSSTLAPLSHINALQPANSDNELVSEASDAPVHKWSLSFETSYLWATTNNPFIFLIKTPLEGPNPTHYRLATQILSARYELTKPGGWSFLRGNWEASLGIFDSTIIHGPEDYIVGALAGLRYTFMPKGSLLSPYIEMRFAVSITNASKVFQGQQQDQTFGYMLGVGLRYQISQRWSASLGTINQHESNLFQTDPNYGFNVMGVSASIERRF